jgi:hypothetical protein
MNSGESEDEITVKLLSAAATDEILVAAAKLGDHPAFAETVGAAFEEIVTNSLSNHKESGGCRGCASRSVDEGLCSFEILRW